MSAFPCPADRPILKLYSQPDSEETDETPSEEQTSKPSAAWTLSRFFERWFLPVVLEAKEADEQTVLIYRDMLRWWRAFTGDPPLKQIDPFTVVTFLEQLRVATYRRGPAGKDRPLARATQAKLLRSLRAVLFRAGYSHDPKRQAMELVQQAPHVVIPMVRSKPKACFSLEQAKAIIGAAKTMERPTVLGIETDAWWRVRIGLFFYTGLRIGTIRQLRWPMFGQRIDGWWLTVPGEITKTGDSIDVAVHPLLAEALLAIRLPGREEELISPWPHDERWFLAIHARLQLAAGIPQEKVLSPHAWRRTHADQINRAGQRIGVKLAQEALGHHNESTTTDSYTNLLNEQRRKLPQLWLPRPKDDGQKQLF